METKNCQNCKQDFNITQDDFSFYEKIGVPAPTFCPECRMARRLIWRNERSLSKRECGLCKKSLISMYSDGAVPVFCTECWNGNDWDQFINARDYNFEKPFFVQLKELFQVNPRFYAYKFGTFVNSEFVNFAKDDKNAYLSYSVIDSEDILYSTLVDISKNSTDCLNIMKVDGCFENINCEGNYNTHFAVKSQSCLDSYFLYDCANCSNCFMSSNLRSQQYYFKNTKLSKEEYFEEIKKLNLNKYSNLISLKLEFNDLVKNHSIHKYASMYASENATGDYLHHVKNVVESFDTHDAENIYYSCRVLHCKDCMDNSGCGYGELIYESMAGTMNSFKDFFCYITIQGCRECEYSLIMKNCSNCFGCVGLTNAQYCILNKQYSKEDYFKTVAKIKNHMMEMPYVDERGRIFSYGEFFPYDMSPFGYNETNAHDYMPVSREEAIEKGYPWKDSDKKSYKTTLLSEDLPDDIFEVPEDIVDQIISCPNNGDQITQCTTAYRIVPAELQFYRQKNFPLPRYCPNCRHYERLKYRNPMKLYKRSCTCTQTTHFHSGNACSNEFETTYAPNRPEKVYCEQCYQAEVL